MKTQGSWVRVVKFVGVTGLCFAVSWWLQPFEAQGRALHKLEQECHRSQRAKHPKSLPRKMIPSGAQPMASCR